MKWFFTALLLLSAPLFAAPAVVTLDNGQIRLPMPGRSVSAGYFTLNNSSEQQMVLTAVSSDAFGRIELHQHSHKDGMMRMEQVGRIDIAAQSSVTLEPGGLHLMLFEPAADLSIGQSVPVLLHFANGQQLETLLPVVAMPKR